MIIKHYISQQLASNVGKSIKQLSLIYNESSFYQCCTDKKSIAAVIKRLDSIPADIKKNKLIGKENYLNWSSNVKIYLTDQQLWDIVGGTNEPPKAENDEAAFKAWSKKNALAF